jgi:hypothetical protein
MFRRAPWLATLALALALPMVACDSTTGMRTGSVTVLLTDEPGDVTEAWVTITDIYLQGEVGDADPPQGRVYLLEGGNEEHELLSLANAVAELVEGVEIPTGTYGQLRVVMSDGCVVTEDGGIFATSGATYEGCEEPTGTLQMPSFAETGAKVLLQGLTITGGQHILLLDFSVLDSFQAPAPPSNQWVVTPVIHAVELEFTVGVTATLSADVDLPDGVALGDFTATLTPALGDPSEGVEFIESDGVFRAEFKYLIPGDGPFEVVLNAPDGWTVEVSPESSQEVNPASGQTATIDWILQSIQASGD